MNITLSNIDGNTIQIEVDLVENTVTIQDPNDGLLWGVVSLSELENAIKFLKDNG